MEYRDVYTAAGEKTGRVVAKREPIGDDEYLLHVHILFKNEAGLYLLQQRSLRAKYFAGQWDVTGGGVDTGEDSADAAVRETWEELGLVIEKSKLVYAGRERTEKYSNLITDVYAVRVSAPVEALSLCPKEVEAVRYVPFAEFVDTVMYNKSEAYRALLYKADALLSSR